MSFNKIGYIKNNHIGNMTNLDPCESVKPEINGDIFTNESPQTHVQCFILLWAQQCKLVLLTHISTAGESDQACDTE